VGFRVWASSAQALVAMASLVEGTAGSAVKAMSSRVCPGIAKATLGLRRERKPQRCVRRQPPPAQRRPVCDQRSRRPGGPFRGQRRRDRRHQPAGRRHRGGLRRRGRCLDRARLGGPGRRRRRHRSRDQAPTTMPIFLRRLASTSSPSCWREAGSTGPGSMTRSRAGPIRTTGAGLDSRALAEGTPISGRPRTTF
jgi:hypothetical protein